MSYGSYFLAFDPSPITDKDQYYKKVKLISTIDDVLNDHRINVKTKGYSFMKDAICIITDLERMDICLNKEVYPLIAKKYEAGGSYAIEHNIRNALNSAYFSCLNFPEQKTLHATCFDGKPTNKVFLLMAVQEVGSRLLKELCD